MPTLPDIQQVFARRGKSQASLRELMAALGVDRRDRITFRRELDRLVRAGALVRLKGHQVYGLPPGRETKGRSGDRTARPLMVGWLSRVGRYGTVTPFDPATDAPVRLFKGACRGLAPGTYLLVRRGPEGIGRIEEVLGDPAQPGTDERAVLLHHDLPHTFPQAVERELAALPERVEQADLAGREDRRDRPIVTIDGPDARDFDDAVEVASRPGGGWRLGVHIADVSRYVAEGSALDREARRRGASCYFPTTVVPMLPHPLSSHLCSLQEGVDRLTLSVELAIDPGGR